MHVLVATKSTPTVVLVPGSRVVEPSQDKLNSPHVLMVSLLSVTSEMVSGKSPVLVNVTDPFAVHPIPEGGESERVSALPDDV